MAEFITDVAGRRIYLRPGQLWRPTKPGGRARPRTLVWVGCPPRGLTGYSIGFTEDPKNPLYPATGHDADNSVGSFKVWIKRNLAVLDGHDHDTREPHPEEMM